MTLSHKFQITLQNFERPLTDPQQSYLLALHDAIDTINRSGDFTARLVLAQSGAVTLYAKKTDWREERLVTLPESDLDAVFRRDKTTAADSMADMIVEELARTLARAQRAAQMKWLLG